MGGDARRLLTGGAVSQAEKSALDLETSGAAGGPWGPVSRCRVYLSVYVSVPMWVNYRLPGADLPLAPPPAGPTQLLIYSWIQGPHQSGTPSPGVGDLLPGSCPTISHRSTSVPFHRLQKP